MDYNKIGEKIRFIRTHELKLIREKFAEEVGVSNLTLARLENGNRKIKNIEIYERIANVTGYSINELLDTSSSLITKPIKDKLNCLLDNLTDDELQYVYDFVRNFIHYTNQRSSD